MGAQATATLIVGAGPAGLALAACLARAGRPAVLLERGHGAGCSWVGRYATLHLHTPRQTSALPYLPLSGDPRGYPDRDEITNYLARYAEHFALDVRGGCEVLAARRSPGGWQLESSAGTWSCRQLVLATGTHRLPREPALPGRQRFPGEVLHSSRYRDGRPFRDRRVLVVGCGNSGADIATDLVAHGARVALAVRGPVLLVPRDLLGRCWQQVHRWLPDAALSLGGIAGASGRTLAWHVSARFWAAVQEARFGDLRRLGLPLRARQAIIAGWRARQPPLTAGRFVALLRSGEVELRPALVDLDEQGAHFADGRREPFDVVVLATGFRDGLAELLPAEDPAAWTAGDALPREGAQPAIPGLYLCGYLPELRRIAASARRIAAALTHGRQPGVAAGRVPGVRHEASD